jgi:amino acid permease
MRKLHAQNPTLSQSSSKRSYYVTELLMLKSIIVLLILTFFLLNEMQASNTEIKSMKNDLLFKTMEMPQDIMATDR